MKASWQSPEVGPALKYNPDTRMGEARAVKKEAPDSPLEKPTAGSTPNDLPVAENVGSAEEKMAAGMAEELQAAGAGAASSSSTGAHQGLSMDWARPTRALALAPSASGCASLAPGPA